MYKIEYLSIFTCFEKKIFYDFWSSNSMGIQIFTIFLLLLHLKSYNPKKL